MSTDRVLANIDAALSAQANAARFDLVAGGAWAPGSTGGDNSAAWFPAPETAISRGWVDMIVATAEEQAAPDPVPLAQCSTRCVHGDLCLGGHQDLPDDHWFDCRLPGCEVSTWTDVHAQRHHLDPDRECVRCLEQFGWALRDEFGQVPAPVPFTEPRRSAPPPDDWWPAMSEPTPPERGLHRAPGALSALWGVVRRAVNPR